QGQQHHPPRRCRQRLQFAHLGQGEPGTAVAAEGDRAPVQLHTFLDDQRPAQAALLFLLDRVPFPFIYPLQLVAAQGGIVRQVHAIQGQRHYRLLSPALSRTPSSLVSSASLRTATSTACRPGTSRRITLPGAWACCGAAPCGCCWASM